MLSAIQSSSGFTTVQTDAGGQSSAMRLLGENQLAGQLDIRGIAAGVLDLAQLNPLDALQVLEHLKDVLAPLDLARLTSDLTGVLGTVGALVGEVLDGPVGDLAGGLTNTAGGLVGVAVEAVAQTKGTMGLDLSKGVDATTIAGPGAARSLDVNSGQELRPGLMTGLDVVANPSFGPVVLPGHRPVRTGSESADILRSKAVSQIDVERAMGGERNMATLTLDAQGRFGRAEAVLSDLERSRTETRTLASDRGMETNHGSQTIGQRLVKDQGLDNLTPQSGGLDTSAYATLENEMGDWVEAGAEVRVSVDVIGGGDKPVRLRVAYEVLSAAGGDVVYENNVIFRNAAEQTLGQTLSSPGG